MLALVDMTTAEDHFPANYYMPLAFPKPSWGKWSLRDVWVINVRRIPSEAPGYCYSKRIVYVDKETSRELWNTIYDSSGNIWKIYMDAYHPRKVPGTDGETIFGRFFAIGWDLQNEHITLGYEDGPDFGDMIGMNSEVPKGYDDISLYSSPGGLMHIMR